MLQPGQFVDSCFPFSERPEHPGPVRHIALVFDILRDRQNQLYAAAYYTTTAADPGGRRQDGTIKVNEVESMRMGMAKPFTIQIWRLAIMPINKDFFPDIDKPHCGIKGTASPHLMKAATRIFQELQAKHAQFETLGPVSQLRHAMAR